jgi:hypothetical protein
MAEQSSTKLVFLDTALFEDGAAIRGGVLVTDLETKPYEFRCTSSVRPTHLQRVLYGDTLDEYVYIELIGLPLIRQTKEPAGLILVRNPLLLKCRPSLPHPIVLVRRDQKSVAQVDAGESEIHPITIVSHREFPAEQKAAQALLTPLLQKRDLLEPFERLQVALSEAHKQKIGESAH